MCQSGHFVHPPVILDGKTVTCNTNSVPKIPPTPSSPTNPHKANTSRPFWDLGSFILSSPTPKHTEKLQKLGFQKLLPVQRIFLPMMQLSDTASSESYSSKSETTSTVKPQCYCESSTCVLTTYTERNFSKRFQKCENYKV
jgi:hypothetical protein